MISKNKSILLIEDNEDDEILTVRALKKLNYNHITVARSGTEALKLLFNNSDANDYFNEENQTDNSSRTIPDLILLDLNLPGINGFSILEKLRDHPLTKHIPIVVLTSSNENKDIEESYKLGANSYIQKPVDFQDFEKVADLIGTYWLNLNIAPSTSNIF